MTKWKPDFDGAATEYSKAGMKNMFPAISLHSLISSLLCLKVKAKALLRLYISLLALTPKLLIL